MGAGRFRCFFLFTVTVISWILGQGSHVAESQTPVRVAQIPGINPGPCSPGPEERPWLNPNQSPGCRAPGTHCPQHRNRPRTGFVKFATINTKYFTM
jgi:hypothetical protein